MTVNAKIWQAALRFEAEVETMRQTLLAEGSGKGEAAEWIRLKVQAYNASEMLPSHCFLPRDTEYDIKAGYGQHNAHPRWGEIVTRDAGGYVGRHRQRIGGDVA